MIETPEQPRGGRWLATAALVLAVSLVMVRATIQQGLRDPDPVVPGGPAAPRQAGPAMGLVLDLLLCTPALLMLLRRVVDPRIRLSFTISHGLFFALALLAAASSFWAADRFAAAVTSAHLLAAAALLWGVSQFVRSWAPVRLIAGACFAILLIGAAQGVIYRTIELPELIRVWEDTKEAEFARRGWAPDSFQAMQFDRRVRAGELLGFNISPNSFAALMVMLGVVSVGAAIQRIVDRDEPGWPTAIILGTAPVLWVLFHTGGRTAAGAAIIAAAILLLTPSLKRRGVIFSAAALAVLAGVGLVVSYGLAYGSLVHSSLTFRWRYWAGAARVFLEHPLKGIGWSNFGDYYLGTRLPIASEEVKDPHNLVVRAFVELGIIGGLLMVGWLGRIAWEITSPAHLPLKPPPTAQRQGRLSAPLIFWICAIATGGSALASIDLAVQTNEAGWFVLLELMERGLYFVLAVLGMAIVLMRSSGGRWLDDRPALWMLRAMGAAVAGFMVCNLVDFSIFEPGPMSAAALLIGAAIGARRAPNEPASGGRTIPVLALGIGTLLWLAAGIGVVIPIALAEHKAHRADALLRQNRRAMAAGLLEDAFNSLWIPNADYPHRAAIAMIYANAPADRVRPLLDSAIHTNPMSTPLYRTRAQFEMRQPQSDTAQVRSDYQRILTLDPANVVVRLEFAAALATFADRPAAVEQYREALRFNDLLDPDEPKRLTEAQIERIQQAIAALEP